MIPEFNSSSNKHLSILFFGGFVKIKVDVPVLDKNGNIILTKTGNKKGDIKTKKVDSEIYIKGLGLKPLSRWKTKKEGEYQTNEKVLRIIANEKE